MIEFNTGMGPEQGISNLNALLSVLNMWEANTDHAIGDVVKSHNVAANSMLYAECIAAGKTGGVEPAWPTVGQTITDGTATWVIHDLRKPVINLQDSMVPVGAGHEFYGDTPPTGYLFCDGMAVSRTAYANLFAVIGTKYGAGDGSTTFNLPDKRSRVGVGLNGADGDFSTLGKTGGEKVHALNVNEIPSHGHGASTDGQGLHSHDFWAQGEGGGRGYGYVGNGANWQGGRIANNGIHGHNVYIANTGGNQPHNNMPPYLVCNYIIKY